MKFKPQIPLMVFTAWCLSIWPNTNCPLHAQAGLRESLEQLDRDSDGRISPEEITPLARPYLERIARARRMSLSRSNEISEFQEAARMYYAVENGVSDEGVRPKPDQNLKSFELDDDMILIPEFGLAEVKYSYTKDDLDEADQILERYDRNDDGFIDRDEARRSRWTHRDPFEMDLNHDNQLSRMELTQRYARRRLLDDASDELIQKSRRVGNGIESSRTRESDRDRDEDSRWWRSGGSGYWLTSSILGRFDLNRNGQLESNETQNLGMPVPTIDINRDGQISRDELFAYTSSLQDAEGDPGEGLPGWFYELDLDRDRQVSLQEFATDWTEQTIQEFSYLDTNGDGLLTSSEVIRSKSVMGGAFVNDSAEILPPRKTIISEIEVVEDLEIASLQVQLSITHSSVGMLDGFLTGPEGQRIELFTEIGGTGDNFEGTTFDDQAREPIIKAISPFKGSFQPEGLTRGQQGLGQFSGTNAKGVWQLVIRATRSDRFGMLHEWRLMIRPSESANGQGFLTRLDGANANGEVPESVTNTSSWPFAARGDFESKSRNRDESEERDSRKSNEDERNRKVAENWVNSAGPEQAKKRQEQLDRYQEWAERMKAAGKEVTAEGKKMFFGDEKSEKNGEKKTQKLERSLDSMKEPR